MRRGSAVARLLAGPVAVLAGVAEAAAAQATPTDLAEHAPASLRGPAVMGLEPWQWVLSLALLVAGLVGSSLVRRLAAGAIGRWLRHDGQPADRRAILRAAQPFGLAAAALLWHAGLPLTGAEGVVLDVLRGAVRLFGTVMGAWAGFRVADFLGAGMARRAARTESRLDDLLVPLVRKTLKGAVLLVAGFALLRGLGVAIGPLLASVGIGGLAVAFAAKDTIENFFGSLAVIVDRPFEVGDTIRVGDVEGDVQEVGFRSTRLLTRRGSLVTLPNAALVRATVERMARGVGSPATVSLWLDPATTAEEIVALRADLEARLGAGLDGRAPGGGRDGAADVRLGAASPSGLELIVRQRLPGAATPSAEAELRERILLEALRAVEGRGVRLARARDADKPGSAERQVRF